MAPATQLTMARPLGLAPMDAAIQPALHLLAEQRALAALADVCRTIEHHRPEAFLVTRAAEAALLQRELDLDRLGLKPGPIEIEDRIQLGDRVYRLPDRTAAVLDEVTQLATAMAAATPTEEMPMYDASYTPATPDDLNGSTGLPQPGFVRRSLTAAYDSLPTLRLPTATEALVAVAVVVAGAGLYLAATSGDLPDATA